MSVPLSEFAAGVVFLLMVGFVLHAIGSWDLLGELVITSESGHERLTVNAAWQDCRTLKLLVFSAAIKVQKLVIHYGSGADRDIDLRLVIPAGGASREIEVGAGDDAVRSLDFWYESPAYGNRRSVVRLLAKS
jgi:hypothetical protein